MRDYGGMPHGDDHSVHAPSGADSHSSPSASYAKVPLLSIFIYTTIMALASGFGAVPFFIFGRLKPYWAGIANAVAVGVMLAASFDLLQEGAPHSPALTILGMVIGALFIKASQDYLSQFEDVSFEDLQGADARKAMLIITVMAAHAFGEGSGVGVSYSGQRGWAQGMLVTIAIGLHNVPEGMAVAGVMMSKGSSPTKALYWTLLCSFPQALVSVPSYMFVEAFTSLLPVALGFAAGCMVWIAFAELIPDALESADHGHVATAATFSAAWLQGLSMLIARLEQPGGALSSPIQAEASALAGHLLFLLPCLAAPLGAAFLASRLAPSLPVLLGGAAGSLAWLGIGGLAGLVLSGRATPLPALGCAVGGACLSAMMLTATKKSAGEEGEEKEEGDEEGGRLESGVAKHQHQQGPEQRHHLQPGWLGAPGAADAHHSSHAWHHAPHSNGIAHVEGLPIRLHQNGESHHEGYYTEPHSRPQHHTLAAPGWAGGHADSHLNGTYSNGQPKYLDEGGGSLAQYQGDKLHALIRGSPGFACAVLATQGVPLGMALGRAVVLDPDSAYAHALLPCLLSALPIGVACAGLGRALTSSHSHQLPLLLALGLAAVAGSALVCFLIGLPIGKDSLSVVRLAGEYEAWVPLVEAAVAGALLLAAFGHAWPQAGGLNRAQRVHTGLGIALALGLGTWLAQAMLCWATPYCLR